MKRWTSVVVGALLVALIAGLVWSSGRSQAKSTASSGEAEASGENRADGLPARDAAPSDPMIAKFLDVDGGAFLPSPGLIDPGEEPSPGSGLPSGSPKTVRFGVILVQYRGAQLAASVTRSKDEALTLARSLSEAAKADFKTQVSRGDPGSMEDAGRIPRGVLEGPVEYALFTLPRGEVSEPIDTPRGFWIVRRIE